MISNKYIIFIQKNNTISIVLVFFNFAIYLTVHFFPPKNTQQRIMKEILIRI